MLACGQNERYQLGITPYMKETKSLKPVSVKAQEELVGVCAGKYHSVFYTKQSLYVCGLNGGQLGLPSDKNNTPFVKVPTQVIYISLIKISYFIFCFIYFFCRFL